MKTSNRSALSLMLFLLPACGGKLVEFPKADGARPDTARADVASADGVNPDARNSDVANTDVVNTDVVNTDVVNTDVANTDAANTDAAVGILDVGNRDVASAETGVIDTRPIETGNRDVGKIDVPIGDARIVDAPILDVSIIDAPVTDAVKIDAAKSDAAIVEAGSPDVGSIDGSGPGPAIVIDLGLASPFAIAATAGVTNTITAPITHINGKVVLTATPTCNGVPVDNAGGFGLCDNKAPTISGTVITDTYPDTTTAIAIKAAMNAAFLSITPLAGPPAVGSLGGGITIAAPTTLGNVTGTALVLGDNWFTPGVYVSGTSILITDDLTLDGQGDPNAVFVFQSASTLTTADGAPGAHARILLTNGTKASNVWWQVASSATIGTYSEFQGNVLAAKNITMKTGSTACGRSMAGAWVGDDGAFVFDSNVVSVPGNGCPL